MQDWTIRPAAAGDAAAIAELAGQLGYPTTPGDAAARLGPILADRGQAFLVAEFAGAVVGWIHVTVTRLVESEPFAELGGFVVDEAHRGRGVGRLLMVAAEEWIRANDIPKLRIRTRSDRDGAHAFYESRGYVLVKEQRIYDKEM
jgi:GNAT superfamily N-acetyltransferase